MIMVLLGLKTTNIIPVDYISLTLKMINSLKKIQTYLFSHKKTPTESVGVKELYKLISYNVL